jgi:hypothetical protein
MGLGAGVRHGNAKIIIRLSSFGIVGPLFAWQDATPKLAMLCLRFGMFAFWVGGLHALYRLWENRTGRALSQLGIWSLRLLALGAGLGLWTLTYLFDPIIDRRPLFYIVTVLIGALESAILIFVYSTLDFCFEPAPS